MNEQKQRLIDALPETGEVEYSVLRSTLIAQGEEGQAALAHFHRMRRDGDITVRTDGSTGELKLYVSRVSAA